jgi:hypothetical protein
MSWLQNIGRICKLTQAPSCLFLFMYSPLSISFSHYTLLFIIIIRFGMACCPLDESLSRVVIDISSRPHAVINMQLTREKLGDISCEVRVPPVPPFYCDSNTVILTMSKSQRLFSTAFPPTTLVTLSSNPNPNPNPSSFTLPCSIQDVETFLRIFCTNGTHHATRY